MTELIAHLHTPTLQFVAVVVMAVTLVAVLVLWRASRAERYLRYWGFGYTLVCGGLTISALRDWLPTELAIIAGNVTTAAGGVIVMLGVAAFVGRAQPRWLLPATIAVVTGGFIVLVYVYPHIEYRIALMSLVFMGLTGRMTWLLWREPTPEMRITQRLLATMLGFQAIYYAAAAVQAVLPGSAQMNVDASLAAAHFNAVYLNAIVVFVLLLFGFTGLAHRRLQLRLEHAAHHDALTGVLNRRALDVHLQRAASEPSLSVVMADLDYFKRLNDRYGHAVGDLALATFAEAVREHLRIGDVFGRIGGEEFCLLLPRTDNATACAIAERLRQVVAGLRLPTEPTVQLSISAGVVTADKPAAGGMAQLLKAADMALYAAKGVGRDCVAAVQLTDEGWSEPIVQARYD